MPENTSAQDDGMEKTFYNLRSRSPIHGTPSSQQQQQYPGKRARDSASSHPSAPGSAQGSSRPRSARLGRRTAPEPGFLPLSELEHGHRPENAASMTDEPPVPKTAESDGMRQRSRGTRRRTPSGSPRTTPEPSTGGKPATRLQQEASANWLTGRVALICVVLLLICLACYGWYWHWSDGVPPTVGFDSAASQSQVVVSRWREAVVALSGQFPYQRPRLWKVLRASVNRMLLEMRQPAVVLLLAGEEQRDDLRCILSWVADATLNATGRAGHAALRVDGSVLGTLDEVEAKGRLNVQLERLGAGGGVGVLVLEELQKLQPRTAMLLHGACDNDNAPHKQAVFLLSVVTKKAPPGDAGLVRAAEGALWQAWGEALGEDIFDALLSRISLNVAAVSGEGSSLLCRRAEL